MSSPWLEVACPKCGAEPSVPCVGCHPACLHTLRAQAYYKREAAAVAAAKFAAVEQDIKQGALTVARAVSKTMAKRIANALNKHVPDRRGQ